MVYICVFCTLLICLKLFMIPNISGCEESSIYNSYVRALPTKHKGHFGKQ